MIQQINLYQPIFRKEQKKFSAVAMFQAIGLVLVGVFAMYGYTWWQTGSLRSEQVRTEQNLAAVTKRLSDATRQFGPIAGSTSIDAELTRLQRDFEAKQRIREILQRGVFSNTTGFSDYFISFARQSLPGVWLTGFDITGAAEQMMLAGRSTNPELVPRYMQKLSNEKSLSGIVFNVFQMNRPASDAGGAQSNYVEFQARTTGSPG